MRRAVVAVVLGMILLLGTSCTQSGGQAAFPEMPANVTWVPADQSPVFTVTTKVGIVKLVPDKGGRGAMTFSVLLESRDGKPHHAVGGTVYLDKELQPYIESGLTVFGSMQGDGTTVDPTGPSKGLSLERVAYVPPGMVGDDLLRAATSPMKLYVWFDDGDKEYLEIPPVSIDLQVVDCPLTP